MLFNWVRLTLDESDVGVKYPAVHTNAVLKNISARRSDEFHCSLFILAPSSVAQTTSTYPKTSQGE
jgi:hypothetical protein